VPFAEFKVKLGNHVYVVAPDAVNEALPNGHIVTLGDTFTTTVFITEIVIIALFVHDPTDVAPIVYDVVTDGVHMTLAAVFVFKYILGVQVYELAPLAVNVIAESGQTLASGDEIITGNGLALMVVVVELKQPFKSVPVTV
jgi:hypothetical protein